MGAKSENRFVNDGYERARSGAVAAIRAEVELEFAERLESAGLFERWRLHREIRCEVAKRIAARGGLDREAPPWGLYITSK